MADIVRIWQHFYEHYRITHTHIHTQYLRAYAFDSIRVSVKYLLA